MASPRIAASVWFELRRAVSFPIIGRIMARDRKKSMHSAATAPFVGRIEELELLERLVEAAMRSRGSVVIITGEHGIGKTRLARELATIAEAGGMTVLWGRGYSDEGAPSYWPWAEIIDGLVATSDPAELLTILGADTADVARVIPAVRKLLPLGDDAPDFPLPGPLDERARYRLFASLRQLLETASRAHPLLITFDDLQYCDPASLLLLDAVTRDVDQCPLMVVGTYVDHLDQSSILSGTLGELAKLPWYHSIRLRALRGEEVAEWLNTLLESGVAQSLAPVALSRTEGNPLFLAEALRLVEYRTDLSAEEASRIWEEELPTKAGVVIGVRLARLPAFCRELLATAAILGGEFSIKHLLLVGGVEESGAIDGLVPAVREGLLEETGADRLKFSHELIRSGILEGLTHVERRDIHQRCGEALVGLRESGRKVSAAALAYHFAQAGPSQEKHAATHAREAGIEALDAYAFESALSYFEAAEATDTLSPLERADLTMLEARALATLTEFARTLRKVSAAFEIYLEQGETELAVNAALFDAFPGLLDYESEPLRETRERALTLVPADSPHAARLLSELGKTFAFRSYDAAAEALDRSLEIARSLGRADLEARALQYRAVMERRYLRFPAYIEVGNQAVEMTRKTGDSHLFVLRGALVAGWALMHGDRPTAERWVWELLSLPEHFRGGIWGYELRRLRLYLAIFQGRWEEARRVIAETDWAGVSEAVVPPLTNAETGEEGADNLFLDVFATKGRIISTRKPSDSVNALYFVGLSQYILVLALLSRLTGDHSNPKIPSFYS